MDDAPGPDADEADEIRLTVPALADYARVVRLAVSGLASRNGFAYDDVEDIRIAVGEVFGTLVDPDDPLVRLRFSTRLTDDGLAVVAERVPAAAIAAPSDLTDQILEAVVDDVVVDPALGRVAFTKRYPS
ncbi:MAG: hypothetical protein KDA98_05600 [Acidimicrobiales bacterium]|nr:hypothetical protein [Acidimicrobiales bacterium]